MKRRQLLAQALKYSGGLQLLDRYWGKDRLTVLAHHRITDPFARDFVGLSANVSATPQAFEQQIAWVAQHFNVIDLATLRDYVVHGQALPEHPLLITFDDGYMDNYTNAFPVLQKYGFPAVIFIVTGSMDQPAPLWWDITAESFRQTTKTSADLPLIGQQVFETETTRETIELQLIEALKHIPEAEKQQKVEALQVALNVVVPDTQMFFGWEQVRELVAHGIACQPHTVTHPILTRIPAAEMVRQITESRRHVMERSGQEVIGFAYPNGSTEDYNQAAIDALQQAGYDMAFTLIPGPMPAEEIRQYPYQIKRVYLSYVDTMEVFETKVMGVPAIQKNKEYL